MVGSLGSSKCSTVKTCYTMGVRVIGHFVFGIRFPTEAVSKLPTGQVSQQDADEAGKNLKITGMKSFRCISIHLQVLVFQDTISTVLSE